MRNFPENSELKIFVPERSPACLTRPYNCTDPKANFCSKVRGCEASRGAIMRDIVDNALCVDSLYSREIAISKYFGIKNLQKFQRKFHEISEKFQIITLGFLS